MRTLLALLLLTGTAWAETPREHTDTLLSQLRTASTEEDAGEIEAQLRAAWTDAASPALRLLLVRGTRELTEGNVSAAFDSFDAVLDLDPELLEGWRGRAQARLRLGDSAGATHDILEVLRREPRHFALAAWQKVLDADPHTEGARDRLRELRRRALGEST